MGKENPYYVLFRFRAWYMEPHSDYKYRIRLCKTDCWREHLVREARYTLSGWAPVHMKKHAADMRDDIALMFSDGNIQDETGVVL